MLYLVAMPIECRLVLAIRCYGQFASSGTGSVSICVWAKFRGITNHAAHIVDLGNSATDDIGLRQVTSPLSHFSRALGSPALGLTLRVPIPSCQRAVPRPQAAFPVVPLPCLL